MVDGTLSGVIKYIKRQLALGHSAQEIKAFLLQKGFSVADLDSCLLEIYSQNNAPSSNIQMRKKHIFPAALLMLIFFGIVSATVYFVFFSDAPSKDADMEFRINFDKQSFSSDELVSFSRNNVVTGDLESFSVNIKYAVTDSSGNIIHSLKEEFFLSGESSREMGFTMAGAAPGMYHFRATADYMDKSSVQTASFIISSPSASGNEGNCFDGVMNQDETGIDCGGPCRPCVRQCPIFYDDNDPCTVSRCGPDTNYMPVHEDIVPCCGNGICEPGENKESCSVDCATPSRTSYFNISTAAPSITSFDDSTPLAQQIDNIKEIAKTDINKAGELCSAIVFPYYKDECFYSIAESSEIEEICGNIDSERTKDKCYTQISKINMDFNSCSLIESSLRRDSCYLGFALKGEYSVCSYIEDEYYAESCRQLEYAAQLSPDVAGEYADLHEW
jgi:hypothetical protein